MDMSSQEQTQHDSPIYRRTVDMLLVGFIVAVAGVMGLSATGLL
jgi:hypothetical protein